MFIVFIMIIVINSHRGGSIALDHLLESMKKQEEFNTYKIIIAIGGFYDNPDYEIIKKDNITYIHCNHNSIDYTGLIALSELYSSAEEHYLYLHDTCKVGDNFYKKLQSINLSNVSSMKLNKVFSMNMGIYSQKIINSFGSFLLGKKNKDETKCMEFKTINYQEDHIFNSDRNNVVLENYNGWNKTEPIDYYNTGTMRIVEYYPNIDLYKIKANWGQGIWTLKV